MANKLSISIDLQKMKNAKLLNIGKDVKKRCICIPIDDNPEIFVGSEKGVYLGLIAIERKEPGQYGDTHLVKGSLPKKVWDTMSDEEKRAQPILGSIRPIGQVSANGNEEMEDEDIPEWMA